MSRLVGIAALAGALVLGGCARMPLGPPSASMDNIVVARSSGIAPVSLGEFRLAAGRPAALDEAVTARTNTYYSPYANSFAQYMKETLAADLRAAGLLDPASTTVVQGWLTDSRFEVPSGAAKAAVAARFVVLRAGKAVYDRELRAEADWKASFIGAEALPDAVNRYGQLYRRLSATLLSDPDFRAAARP
jgi:hypothetical protein